VGTWGISLTYGIVKIRKDFLTVRVKELEARQRGQNFVEYRPLEQSIGVGSSTRFQVQAWHDGFSVRAEVILERMHVGR